MYGPSTWTNINGRYTELAAVRYTMIVSFITCTVVSFTCQVFNIPIPVWVLKAEDRMTSPRVVQVSLVIFLVSESDE